IGADIKNIERADAAEAELRASGAINTPVVPVNADQAQENAEKLAVQYRRAFIHALKDVSSGSMGFGGDAKIQTRLEQLTNPKVREIMNRAVSYEKNFEQRDLLEGAPMNAHI